ncbi:MAG TPA: hypothetical protein VFZ61_12290 [Polyangiales bacterium]
MQTQHIALVPEAGGVSAAELLRVAAALQKQVGTQFGPLWEVQASVDPFLELEEVPAGYTPILVSPPDRVAQDLSFHVDENGQPFARVRLGPTWSLHASRACLELLVNPYGRRTLSAASPRSDQGPADILLEVCGAFGSCPVAYAVNDVAVADFCTPAFFRSTALHGSERYSYCGALAVPMQLLRGGRLAWFDAISNSWWLRSGLDGQIQDFQLGALPDRVQSPRELVEQHALGLGLPPPPADTLYSRVRWRFLCEQAQAAARARAQRLRERLDTPADLAESAVPEQVTSAAREPERRTLQSFPPPPPALPKATKPRLESAPVPTFAVDRAYVDEARRAQRAGDEPADEQTPVLGSEVPIDPIADDAKQRRSRSGAVPPMLSPTALLERPSERKGPPFVLLAAAALLLGAGVQFLTRDDVSADATTASPKLHAQATNVSRAQRAPAASELEPLQAMATTALISAREPSAPVQPVMQQRSAPTASVPQERSAGSSRSSSSSAEDRPSRRENARRAERENAEQGPVVREPAPVAPLPPSIEDLIESRR